MVGNRGGNTPLVGFNAPRCNLIRVGEESLTWKNYPNRATVIRPKGIQTGVLRKV